MNGPNLQRENHMKSSLLNPFRIGQRSATFSRTIRRAALTMALLSGVPIAHAQLTTADILGTVTDLTGAAISNAWVQVKNLGTNDTRNGSTDGSGNFSFTKTPNNISVAVTNLSLSIAGIVSAYVSAFKMSLVGTGMLLAGVALYKWRSTTMATNNSAR